MKLIQYVPKIISFSLFTYLNNCLIDGFSIDSIKKIAFLFLECILLLLFSNIEDEKERKYHEVCLQNINFYNQILKLEESIKEVNKEKTEIERDIRMKFENNLLKYQLQIKKCIFPFCLNKYENDKLCKEHIKYKTEECVICYEKFDKEDYPLKCGHWIHKKCLRLTKKNNCSLCKEENNYFN